MRGGVAQTYDMVFVPHPALDRSLLGLGAGLPRAVPSDLLVALATRALPAAVVQRLVLGLPLLLGAWGAARLLAHVVPGTGRTALAVTAVTAVWAPATYERLVLGQWALLVSTAALPWVVLGGLRLREQGRWVPLLPALAAAACGSPAGALLAVAVAVVVAGWGPAPRPGLLTAAVGGLLVLPWLLPALLRPGGSASDPAGLAAFAPAGELGGGPLGTLLLRGGVWNREVAPPTGPATALLLAAVVALAGYGLLAARPRALRPLVACAALGLLLALLPRVPGLDAVARAAVGAVPGAGLLRDGQKFAAPYALLVALGLGLAAQRLLARLPALPARRSGGLALALLPVAAVPALAWGAGGRLVPVALPAEYGRLDALVAAAPGRVAVLPWSAYRRPAWNGGRTLLDPVPRLLGRTVVVADDLPLGDGTVVQGEDPLAAALDPLMAGTEPLTGPLAAAGVGWVVLERGEPGADQALARLAGAERVLDGRDVVLLELPAPAAVADTGPPVVPVVVADLAVLALLGGAAVRGLRRRVRREGG